MAYLITQLMWWLIAAAAFAGLAGWSVYSMRSKPKLDSLERERARLMSELVHAAPTGAFSGVGVLGYEREAETLRRRAEIDAGRIAELEGALGVARARLQESAESAAELEALRARVSEIEEQRSAQIQDAEFDEAEEDSAMVKAWRLRYFEKRVRYLESQASTEPSFATLAAPESEPAPEPEPAPVVAPVADLAGQWRARYFEQRTRFLEDALRAAPVVEAAPQALPAPSMDWREAQSAAWRLRYLTQRVAHLQDEAAVRPEPAPDSSGEDGELEAQRLKWRVRYLESRLRHLERAPLQAVLVADEVEEDDEEAPAPRALSAPSADAQRPPGLPAAQDGAPDDFTLIAGVSLLQQSTLNSLGVYHFDQIAAWSPGNVAWVDHYLRLRGRIVSENWVAQAAALARGEGVARSERMPEDEVA